MPETLQLSKTKPQSKNEKLAQLQKEKEKHNFYNVKLKDGVLYAIYIKKARIVNKLIEMNFFRYDINPDAYMYVKITENQIEEINEEIITDSFFEYVDKLNTYEHEIPSKEGPVNISVSKTLVRETLMEKISEYFSKRLFNRLIIPGTVQIKKDDKDAKFLYFNNAYIQITSKGYETLSYSTLDQLIWKNKILSREFKQDKKQGDFELFFKRICGHTGKPDETPGERVQKRIRSLKTITGYLLHGYFDYKMYALILTDSRISDDDEPNGRTGKTLFAKALGKILNYNEHSRVFMEVNGKNFIQKDKHRYEECSLETQLISINDVNKNMPIDTWFNDITEGVSVNKKNEKPFLVRAKIIISTNKTIKIDGESAIDRVRQFEFSDYYDSNKSPEGESGRWFFSQDWDASEWNRFDTFLISCCQEYLKYGIIEAESINLSRRILIDHSNYEFVDFMDEFVKDGKVMMKDEADGGLFESFIEFKPGEKLNRAELHEAFAQSFPRDFRNLTTNKFTKWLRLYTKHTPGFIESSTKNGLIGRTNNINWIIFKLKEEDQ